MIALSGLCVSAVRLRFFFFRVPIFFFLPATLLDSLRAVSALPMSPHAPALLQSIVSWNKPPGSLQSRERDLFAYGVWRTNIVCDGYLLSVTSLLSASLINGQPLKNY